MALIILPLLMIAIYVFTIKGVVGNPVPLDFKNNLDQAAKPLELSPERGRFALTMSIVENGTFALSQTLADAVYPDVGYYGGNFYIFFAPGISVLAAPLYMLGSKFNLSQVASFSLSAIFAVLNAVYIYLISKWVFKLPPWAGLFGSLVFSFGSTAWAYAVTLYQHQATTFFILSAFYSAWKYRQKGKWSWLHAVWVWSAAGLAVAIDYPNSLFMIPVLTFFSLSSINITKYKQKINFSFRPLIIISSLAFVILMVIHGYYNYVHFGHPMRLSGSIVGYKAIKEKQLLGTQESKESIDKLAENKNPVSYFSEEKFPMGLTILTVSPDRGIFLYSPIYLVGILGVILAIRKNRSLETSILVANILTIVFLYSSWGDPWGGWAFGPRYLIPALGILSIFIAFSLSYVRHFIFRIITFLLFIYSSAIAILGVLTTNAVPPRIEAVALNSGYNFLHNWIFFKDNHSSSVIYNTFFYKKISLLYYALPIYSVILILAVIFLFILPRLEKRHGN